MKACSKDPYETLESQQRLFSEMTSLENLLNDKAALDAKWREVVTMSEIFEVGTDSYRAEQRLRCFEALLPSAISRMILKLSLLNFVATKCLKGQHTINFHQPVIP